MGPVKMEVDGASQDGSKPAATHNALSSKRQKVKDFRLASHMEDQRFVREHLREHNRLIIWSPQKVNVITLEALGLNSRVMSLVADFHCSQSTIVKPPPINYLKAQVGNNPKLQF